MRGAARHINNPYLVFLGDGAVRLMARADRAWDTEMVTGCNRPEGRVPEKLKAFLSGIDAVWINGDNAFILCRVMKSLFMKRAEFHMAPLQRTGSRLPADTAMGTGAVIYQKHYKMGCSRPPEPD
jgi:hypothetical protein